MYILGITSIGSTKKYNPNLSCNQTLLSMISIVYVSYFFVDSLNDLAEGSISLGEVNARIDKVGESTFDPIQAEVLGQIRQIAGEIYTAADESGDV